MAERRGRWPKIQWMDGLRASGLYTKAEFLVAARQQYPERRYWRIRGDREIHEGQFKINDINAWMTFTGAKYTWTF